MVDLVRIYFPRIGPGHNGVGEVSRYTGSPVQEYQGLRVIPYHDGTVLHGSLAKFWQGENVTPMTLEMVRDALRDLESRVGIELSKGQVHKLEVGRTLLVKRLPRTYLEAWATFGAFRKSTWKDCQTVTVGNESRAFIGYDKGAEVRSASKRRQGSGKLPQVYKGYYGLRLEMKYKSHKAVKEILGRPLSPWDLGEENVFATLREQWKSFYFKIPKARLTLVSLDGLTPAEFKCALAHLGLQALGTGRANEIIRNGQATGGVSKQSAKLMRKALRDLARNPRITDTSVLTEEIDDIMRRL